MNRDFIRSEHCPSTTVQTNFDYSGIPLYITFHMASCANCREYILSPPIRQTMHKGMVYIRDLSIARWKTNQDPHINERYLEMLLKLQYSKEDSDLIISHIEQCQRCLEFAEKKRSLFQRKLNLKDP